MNEELTKKIEKLSLDIINTNFSISNSIEEVDYDLLDRVERDLIATYQPNFLLYFKWYGRLEIINFLSFNDILSWNNIFNIEKRIYNYHDEYIIDTQDQLFILRGLCGRNY
ncbi:hypothetical protein [Vibrio anguillarum]|nr:hypothetical protein [Vibrio anguillarum]MBF4230441.1 hypothetical protein [Vibrio anguillarum]